MGAEFKKIADKSAPRRPLILGGKHANIQTSSLTSTRLAPAHILALNKLIGENNVINAQTLPKVKMPNADNFVIRFPDRI